MSHANKFGTACKTCRRRGRKCDRSLPTCRSCSERGVDCEGYVLRWVGVAARGHLAGQTNPTSYNGMNSHLDENNQAKVTSNAEPPEAFIHVAEDTTSGVQDKSSQTTTILRQQNWHVSSVMELSGDNLEGLIEYCMKSLRI
jgi:hypothetical protein